MIKLRMYGTQWYP